MEPCRNLNFQVHLAFTAQRWTSLQLADTKEAWRCVQPVDWPSGGHSSHQSGKTRRTTSPAHKHLIALLSSESPDYIHLTEKNRRFVSFSIKKTKHLMISSFSSSPILFC